MRWDSFRRERSGRGLDATIDVRGAFRSQSRRFGILLRVKIVVLVLAGVAPHRADARGDRSLAIPGSTFCSTSTPTDVLFGQIWANLHAEVLSDTTAADYLADAAAPMPRT